MRRTVEDLKHIDLETYKVKQFISLTALLGRQFGVQMGCFWVFRGKQVCLGVKKGVGT